MRSKLMLGDCRDSMLALPPGSVDAIVSDPPYGLEFMGRGWDYGVPGKSFWTAALRAAKPGAHMFAFGGTRLYHRMACSIEDAGWEVRDCLIWMYASAMPHSYDIAKGVDSMFGAKREVVGTARMVDTKKVRPGFSGAAHGGGGGRHDLKTVELTVSATELAKQFDGYGTTIAPSWEPIILAMKPMDGTFAENAVKHGVAGINIDGGRSGRGTWPRNVALDERAAITLGKHRRHFYCAKASKRDRTYTDPKTGKLTQSDHPTVKPLSLMRWLVRLAKPPRDNAVILDPFMGSGSTGVACALEGVGTFVGCERVDHFMDIAAARISEAVAHRSSRATRKAKTL